MHKPFSPLVAVLTLSGTLPFILSAFIALFPVELASLLKRDLDGADLVMTLGRLSLLAYGAVILSFMTGIRWGMELREHQDEINPIVMGLAVIPSILAWAALVVGLLPGNWMSGAMFILAGCFLMLLAWDLVTELPNWYFQLRITATLIACASLIAIAFTALP